MYNQTSQTSAKGSPGRRLGMSANKYGRQRKESLNLMRDSNALEGSTLFELLNHDGGIDNTWKFAEFDDSHDSKTPDMRDKRKFNDRN